MSIEKLVKDLEGRSEAALRNLLPAAHQAESDAKKELYVLRQRVTVLASDAIGEENHMIQAVEKRVAEAIAYVKAIIAKLEGKNVPAPVAPPTPTEPNPTVTPAEPTEAPAAS